MASGSAATSRAGLLLFAAALLGAWLIADPRTPDLAAATYRVEVFRQLGFTLVDERWYAGHDVPGYSLLFPPLGALLGLRAVGALAVLASSVLFERLARSLYGAPATAAAAFFTVAAVGDVWAGRVAFALGVPFALAAALSLRRGHPLWAGALAAACAAASPVAGVLLALAGLTVSVLERSPRALVVLGAPAAVVVLALAALFPEGGYEPYPLLSFLATAGVVGLFLVALPAGEGGRALRVGGVVYLLASVLCLLVRSPVGSNVERYGVLLAGPLLLCARGGSARARFPGQARAMGVAGAVSAAGALSAAALVASAVWVLWGPVRETAAVAGSPATSAAYYTPLERFLAHSPGGPVRVEVPLTRSHWEAALLAPDVALARGWEKQLEERYDHVLLTPDVSAGAYERWLHEQAVSYVALPDVPLDPSSAGEGRLIESGPPFLREVFHSAHWRVYRVAEATPLLSGPGTLTALGHDSFSLFAGRGGSFLVRVRYSRYWAVTRGQACVAPAREGWTRVRASAAGEVTVAARFSLGAAFGSTGSCPSGASPESLGPVPGPATGFVPLRGSVGSLPLYRWMVPTSGPAPSIAEENGARGTSAWRLPGPRKLIGGEAHGAIAAYVSSQWVAPGEIERVYVRAPGARTVTIEVFRMGWYGGSGGRLVLQSAPLRTRPQPPCGHSLQTGLTECRWHATLVFGLPRALVSGVYIVKLRASTGAISDCMFVLRPSSPPPLLVEIPTATYEAYNAWGGDSLYPGGSDRVGVTGTHQGVEVSYERPYATQTGAGEFFIREVAIVRFLERYGYPLGYTTIDSLDRDPGQLEGVRGFIDVGHSEYWSAGDERALARALARDTSLIFLSSDTMAWRVRFRGERIIAYKEFSSLDPKRGDVTGIFPNGGAQLVGSAYDGCITPRVKQPGPPVYRYYPWLPSPSLSPRWLFANTGVSAGVAIPGIVGYELDERTAAAPAGTEVLGSGTGVPCMGEDEPSAVRGTIAQSTLYHAPSGAFVFATGTLGWLYGLSPVPQASPDAPAAPDPRVVAMTRNLLARALAGGR